jgi:hypothetical protein
MARDLDSKTADGLEKKITDINNVTFFVVIVLLVGFVSILVAYLSFIADSNRGREATYETLVDKVNSANYKIDLLTNELYKQPSSSNATTTK